MILIIKSFKRIKDKYSSNFNIKDRDEDYKKINKPYIANKKTSFIESVNIRIRYYLA